MASINNLLIKLILIKILNKPPWVTIVFFSVFNDHILY